MERKEGGRDVGREGWRKGEKEGEKGKRGKRGDHVVLVYKERKSEIER